MSDMIDYLEVRKRISSCPDPFIRATLSTIYLCCARVSEVVHYPSNPYGLKAEDLSEIYFAHEGMNQPVVVFSVKTAKRKGFIRKVPIPVHFDPLLKYVLFHKKLIGSGFMFPISRTALWKEVKRLGVFNGLTYRIYPYIREGIGKVEEHEKDAGLHFLRHARANELAYHYDLTTEEIASIGGWKLSTMQGTAPNILTPVMERYIYLNYQKYLHKLFYDPPPAPSRLESLPTRPSSVKPVS